MAQAYGMGNTQFMQENFQTLFDFTRLGEEKQWFVRDDVVMGGASQSTLVRTAHDTTAFIGTVSFENNGGLQQ